MTQWKQGLSFFLWNKNSLSETAIPDFCDFEYELRDISRTLSILDVGTVSPTVRSGNGPYIKKNHAHSALHAVFSITQLEHSITSVITEIRMLMEFIFLEKNAILKT